MTHELRFGSRKNRANLLIEMQRNAGRMTRFDVHLDRAVVQVARLAGPLLALAAVRWQLQDASIGATEFLVAVKNGLHEVVPCRQVVQMRRGPAEGGLTNDDRLAGFPGIDVLTKHKGRGKHFVGRDVAARFSAQVTAEQKDHAPVERRPALGGREIDHDASSVGRAGRTRARQPDQAQPAGNSGS